MNHEHRRQRESGNGARSKSKWVFMAFLAIGTYFLITEHKAHLSGYLQYWPYLLLLACPLLHIFMHGGHGDHQRREKGDRHE
jgi:hypothetical protein